MDFESACFDRKDLERLIEDLPDPSEVEIRFEHITDNDNQILNKPEGLELYGPFGTKLAEIQLVNNLKNIYKIKNPQKEHLLKTTQIYEDSNHKLWFKVQKVVWEKDKAKIEMEPYFKIIISYSGQEPEWISNFIKKTKNIKNMYSEIKLEPTYKKDDI